MTSNLSRSLLIIILIALISCSPKEIPETNLVIKEGLRFENSSQTPFSGAAVSYHESGRLKSRANYRDGEPHGVVSCFVNLFSKMDNNMV